MTRQQLQKHLEQIKESTHAEAAIYTPDGKEKLSCFEGTKPAAADVQAFAEEHAPWEKKEGLWYFRMEQEGQLLGVLILFPTPVTDTKEKASALTETIPDTCMEMMGCLAAGQLALTLSAEKTGVDRPGFFARLLKNELSPEEIESFSARLRLDIKAPRLIYLIETESPHNKNIRQLIKSLYPESSHNYLLSLDEDHLILIAKYTKTDPGLFSETAETIVDMLSMEAMCNSFVAYSTATRDLKELPGALKEARTALEVGRIFDADSRVYAYASLGVGRLLYKLPRSTCRLYLKEVFPADNVEKAPTENPAGEELPSVFDAEMLHLVEIFFENNLNISEAARQLYIHRNTLINRLDRIEKETGLDLRTFSDAMRLELALLVRAYLKAHRPDEGSDV